MSKPRFPLSVHREFVYRAFLDTGEILESSSFKSVFMHTRTNLRCEVDSVSSYINDRANYRSCFARFEFGYYTSYEIEKGFCYGEWTCIRELGDMFISSVIEEVFYRVNESICNDYVFKRGEFSDER